MKWTLPRSTLPVRHLNRSEDEAKEGGPASFVEATNTGRTPANVAPKYLSIEVRGISFQERCQEASAIVKGGAVHPMTREMMVHTAASHLLQQTPV